MNKTLMKIMLCFSASHEWLLSESVDILPHLLLPLAGPEELDEDEMEKLPPDLQYLGDDKERESDPVIRRMLLEALLQVIDVKIDFFQYHHYKRVFDTHKLVKINENFLLNAIF